MQSENEYIGNDKFRKFLEHYECPTPFDVVVMRFAGAICSPNLELRPTDVISSFWDRDHQPRLETKNEAELFFKFFMGLWDYVFDKIRRNKLDLPQPDKDLKHNVYEWCQRRHEMLEYGYLEGFWGGRQDLNIPTYIAQILDSLSELADVYAALAQRSINDKENEQLYKTVLHTDKMVEKALDFIIENSVLPRIADLQRTMN